MGNIVPQLRDVDVGRYYPPTVSPAKEFQAIANAENPELKKIWIEVWKQFMNTFVYDIDEDGASRWESMLKLYPSKSDTLETRRKAILAKINSMLPYTERSLQAMLDSIYGASKVAIKLKYNQYEFWLDLSSELLLKSIIIRDFARVIIPANLTINISNTIKFDFGLYYGGVVKQTKHVSIYPNGDFTVDIDNSKFIIAGVVRQAKHFTLRS